jgi:hypothetical protein
VYNKTVPDDDFIKSKQGVIETQVFLLVVLTDKIKSIYTIHHRMPKYRLPVNLFVNFRGDTRAKIRYADEYKNSWSLFEIEEF